MFPLPFFWCDIHKCALKQRDGNPATDQLSCTGENERLFMSLDPHVTEPTPELCVCSQSSADGVQTCRVHTVQRRAAFQLVVARRRGVKFSLCVSVRAVTHAWFQGSIRLVEVILMRLDWWLKDAFALPCSSKGPPAARADVPCGIGFCCIALHLRRKLQRPWGVIWLTKQKKAGKRKNPPPKQ